MTKIRSHRLILLLVNLPLLAWSCAGSLPRFTSQNPAAPSEAPELEGVASYYGDEFVGRQTSSGEIYTHEALTAAHRSLPLGTKIRVINLENGRSLVVKVNDRGPWKSERILDLSLAAANQLGMIKSGTARVRIEVLP